MLADAEVQRAAVLVARERLGGVLGRDERRLALHRGVVALGQVGRAAPQLRQHRRERLQHLAGRGLRVAMPLASAGNSGSASVQPSGSARAAIRSSSAGALRVGLRPGVEAGLSHSACAARPRSTHLRACASTSVVDLRTSASGSKPRISLVAATSSAPSAEPWILPVFCLFGAGQPMMVRSAMNDGRPVSALAASDRRVQRLDVLVVVALSASPLRQSTVCTCQPYAS